MGAAPATSRASTLAACGDVVDERNASTDGRLPDPRPDESALKLRLAELAGHLAASERAGGWAHALGSPLGAIAQFAEAGLLDQLMVSIAPVTLGAGRPLFPHRFDLELKDVARNRSFVCATYSVVGPMAPSGEGPAS